MKILAAFVFMMVVCTAVYMMLGSGGYNRWTKISGVYAVEPAGYNNTVCFLEAKRDGISCLYKDQARK